MKKYTCVIALLTLFALPLFADATPDGAAIYKSKCAMCHGADGEGQTSMGKKLNMKSLASAEVQKMSDAELVKVTADGKGKMPAYKSKLSAEEIQAVVAFIRGFKK